MHENDINKRRNITLTLNDIYNKDSFLYLNQVHQFKEMKILDMPAISATNNKYLTRKEMHQRDITIALLCRK